MSAPVLELKDLHAYFFTRRGVVKAVNGISFKVHPGETLGIVGESGSGKSVTQMSYLGLLPSPPLKIVSGSAFYREHNLIGASNKTLRKIRGNKIAMIFQEPMTSLNPYLRIGSQIIEPLVEHKGLSKKAALREAEAALTRVGIPSPGTLLKAFPHEFSGGMRQRVMIAMALTTKPDVLIADEPTTALDVTVQAQILDLLKEIQKDTGMAIVLITHDLGVVASMADRILVMYAGRVFEKGESDVVFERSQHPYTHALLKSTPRLDTPTGTLPTIQGSPPDLAQVGEGCPFFDRCDLRKDICKAEFPKAHSLAQQHESYCHVQMSGQMGEHPGGPL